MATKKECDRCKCQWTPKGDEYARNYNNELTGDQKLAILELKIPYNERVSKHSGNEQINQRYELCQQCGREIHKFIKEGAANPEEIR